MTLKKLIEKNKKSIINKWFNLIVDTYPVDTRGFIKSRKDPFSNPVGNTTKQSLDFLLDAIFSQADYETVETHIDPIVRIRAVQDFTASKTVAFIPDLKKIVRDTAGDLLFEKDMFSQWLEFEHKIDAFTLIGFDIYMHCKEKIYDLKAKFEKNTVYKAFERAGLIDADAENRENKENHHASSS